MNKHSAVLLAVVLTAGCWSPFTRGPADRDAFMPPYSEAMLIDHGVPPTAARRILRTCGPERQFVDIREVCYSSGNDAEFLAVAFSINRPVYHSSVILKRAYLAQNWSDAEFFYVISTQIPDACQLIDLSWEKMRPHLESDQELIDRIKGGKASAMEDNY